MTAIVPDIPAAAADPGASHVLLHVDEVLGVADVSVHGSIAPGEVARVAATLSCRLHAAIGRAQTAVVVDLGGAHGCDPTDPALARVLECARAGAAARGLSLDVI